MSSSQRPWDGFVDLSARMHLYTDGKMYPMSREIPKGPSTEEITVCKYTQEALDKFAAGNYGLSNCDVLREDPRLLLGFRAGQHRNGTWHIEVYPDE